MAIPQARVNEVMAKCARHCCICRRFRPLHLHVHHIREQHDGGTDEFDNLIATCITCHSDIHTETKLTRRFNEKELKLHRDHVYQLIADGKLAGREENDDGSAIDRFAAVLLGMMPSVASVNSPTTDPPPELYPEAVEILLKAAQDENPISLTNINGATWVFAGGKSFGEIGNQRLSARLRRAVEQLHSADLIETDRSFYCVTEAGFALADTLLATATKPTD